jgi:hypothetical protein
MSIKLWLSVWLFKFNSLTFIWVSDCCLMSNEKLFSYIMTSTSYSQVDWFMVSNVTFNNISVISWWSLLMVEETRVPDKLHHIMLYRLHLVMKGVRTHNIRGTDCTGSCKSNYHTITTTTAPCQIDSLSYQTKHYEKRGSNNVDQHF